MTSLYLGVDAGNSKTVALVADASGEVLGRGRAGSGDIYGAESAGHAVAAVISAVQGAVSSAGASLADVRHGAFRLAGVDWDEDADYWRRALGVELAGLGSCSIKNDGYSLLRCGDLSGLGVAIIAGTGPAIAARGPGGAEFSASWWIQELLGGRGLGHAAFTAVMNADLGLAPATSLTEELLALFGAGDVEALLYAFTRREGARPDSDQWWAARSVLRAAGAGDRVAEEIVRHQARRLAGHGRVAAEKVGLPVDGEPVTVVLGGSVADSEHGALRDALTEELGLAVPGATVRSSVGSPLAGALLDALAEAGVALDAGTRERVVQARHPEDFLLTS